MSVTWIYVISIVLYIVLILLNIINKTMEKKFIATYTGAKVFRVRQKDFFWTVAVMCTIITVIINGLSLIGGNGLQNHSIVITLLILGMAGMSIHTKVIVCERRFHVAGFKLDIESIQSFDQKSTRSTVKNIIQFNKAINGYEGVEFYAPKEDAMKIKEHYELYK